MEVEKIQKIVNENIKQVRKPYEERLVNFLEWYSYYAPHHVKEQYIINMCKLDEYPNEFYTMKSMKDFTYSFSNYLFWYFPDELKEKWDNMIEDTKYLCDGQELEGEITIEKVMYFKNVVENFRRIYIKKPIYFFV